MMRSVIQSVTDFSRQVDDFVKSDKFIHYLEIATSALKLISVVIGVQLIASLYASVTAFAAGATAAGLFGTALTLMGGPIGIVVIGLFALYEILEKVVGTNADNLTKQLQAAASQGIAPLNQHIHELTDRQEKLRKAIDATSESAKYSSAAANQLSKSQLELDAVTNSLTEAEELLREQLAQNATASDASTDAADSLTAQFKELERGIENGLDPAIEGNIRLVENHTEKFADLRRELESQKTAIGMTARELALYTAQSKLGAEATLDEKIEIERMVGALYDAEEQYKQTTLKSIENTKAAEDSEAKHIALTNSLSLQMTQLGMTERELYAYNQQSKLGATATLEQRLEIESQSLSLYDAKEAHKAAAEATKEHTDAQEIHKNTIENVQKSFGDLIYKTLDDGKLNFKSFFTSVLDGFKRMIAELVAQKIMNAIFGGGGLNGFLSALSGGFSSIFATIGSSIALMASKAASGIASIVGGSGGAAAGAAGGSAAGSVLAGAGGAAATQTAIAAGTSTMAANAALAAGTSTAAGSIAAGTSTMAANAAIGAAATGTAATSTAAAGTAAAGTTAGSGGFSSALASAGPYAAAILAAYVAAKLLDSGGTPTKTAGLTSAKTGGMSEGNIVRGLQSFASGYTPLGFKQNANDQEVATAIAPFRELDATLTGMAQDLGLSVNLAGHTFNGYGVEGTGAGTVLGTFIEENKMKGAKLSDQVNRYASEWINAVGARNGIASSVIADVIGDGNTAGIISRASEIISASGMGPLGGSSSGSDITLGVGTGNRFDSATDTNNNGMTLTVDGSHNSGLGAVPYDGYIAELHAGERVQTRAQVASTDRMSNEMVGLRNNLNELMLVVAKAVTKTARIEDRWDKNGLPPVRA